MADITIKIVIFFGVFSISLATANPWLVALSIVAMVIVIAYVVCHFSGGFTCAPPGMTRKREDLL